MPPEFIKNMLILLGMGIFVKRYEGSSREAKERKKCVLVAAIYL